LVLFSSQYLVLISERRENSLKNTLSFAVTLEDETNVFKNIGIVTIIMLKIIMDTNSSIKVKAL
jgi:hypothetical protein